MDEMTFLWKDRRRRLGLPLSFTRYRINEDRIFQEKGFFNIHSEEVLLYRVRDLELKMSLWQRIFGVGTVCIHSSDKTRPTLELVSVKQPREVKELIFRQVELAKENRRMRTMEMLSDQENAGGEEQEDDAMDGEEG